MEMDREAEQQRETEVGELLRAHRLQAGLTISKASETLCIREAYLKAIEDGRFADLPGPTYVAGFIRTYSEHLGLDGNEVVRQLKAEPLNIDGSSELRFPSPSSEGGMPTGAILLVGVLVAMVAYGAWYVISTKDDGVAELISPLPERLVAFLRDGNESVNDEETVQSQSTAGTPLPRSTGSHSEQSAEKRAPPAPFSERTTIERSRDSTSVEAPSSPASVTREEAASVPRLAAESRPSAPTSPGNRRDVLTSADDGTSQAARIDRADVEDGSAPAVQDRNFVSTPVAHGNSREPGTQQPVLDIGQPEASDTASVSGARIVLQAKRESWVEIREKSTNRLIFAKLLKPGDTFQVPEDPKSTLLTGNAGGLEILVDGEPVPKLGAEGTVRRNIPLDAGQLRSGTLARN